MRYIARQIAEGSMYGHLAGTWEVVDEETGNGIFGCQMPRDKEEAEQCARAANIAASEVKSALRDDIEAVLKRFNFRS